MSEFDVGRLIITATENIHLTRALTQRELQDAHKIASFLSTSKRNWIPLYVKELSVYNYELVANFIILEAAKIAGLEEIYCIQIDDKIETEEQIINIQSVLTKENKTKIVLRINREERETIKQKLLIVKGIGEKTIEDIIEKRPFLSEADLRKEVKSLKISNNSSKTSKSEQTFQALKELYDLDFSIQSNELD